MKNILKAVLASLFITSAACTQTPVFTTVCSSDNDILAGVKIVREGWELKSYILRVSLDKQKSSKVMLPEEISNREIIGLFPAENHALIVMSQWTFEQGDNPQFHRYDGKTGKWKKIGETDCVSFHRVKVEKNTLILFYTGFDSSGSEIKLQKEVRLNEVRLTRLGEFDVPVVSVNNGSVRAELIGEKFKWNALKVRISEKEMVFKP